MKPGRELDALIAEKVMGWDSIEFAGKRIWSDPNFVKKYGAAANLILVPEGCEGPPNYSTDIAAAWEVVEKLQSLGISFSMVWDAHKTCKVFNVSNYHNGFPCRGGKGKKEFEIVEETAQHAICLAALKAVNTRR